MDNILQSMYDSEINVRFHSFWDAGMAFSLGDLSNGFTATKTFYNYAEGVRWLANQAVKQYPESEFAKTYKAENWRVNESKDRT